MKTYAYVLKLDPRLYDESSWTDEDNKAVNDHFLRLQNDYQLGKVLHVGRTEDPTYEGYGFVVYQAENDVEAKKYMEDDPAVKGGQMTASYQSYKVVFK
jgi:uncharacterized protein YciI